LNQLTRYGSNFKLEKTIILGIVSDGISVLGVAFGQVLARSLRTGPILPAVLEETAALSAQTILLNCVIRMLLAGILAGSCEFLLKVFFQVT